MKEFNVYITIIYSVKKVADCRWGNGSNTLMISVREHVIIGVSQWIIN